jgi:integrase/recombinase XerD
MNRWASDLRGRRKANGALLAPATVANLLYAARGFFRSLAKRRVILCDPSAELRIPTMPQPLPRAVPVTEEVLQILDGPDLRSRLGLRDRAVLEVLYSAGIRRGELVRLCVEDLDLRSGTLFVHRGKGGRDRVVPLGDRAIHWVSRYLKAVRPMLAAASACRFLFLTRNGRPLRPTSIADRLRPYVASVGRPGSCHVFRHACATHMVEGGADIRYVQELLGHVRLATTQVYARVTIEALKMVHAASHPTGFTTRPTPVRTPVVPRFVFHPRARVASRRATSRARRDKQ